MALLSIRVSVTFLFPRPMANIRPVSPTYYNIYMIISYTVGFPPKCLDEIISHLVLMIGISTLNFDHNLAARNYELWLNYE